MSDTRPAESRPADADVVAALRSGDDATFVALVGAWSPGMLSVARAHVGDAHTAEDVVQEAWLAFLRGLDRFEGRSSLRTWAFRIVINLAKARGRRDARVVPMGHLADRDSGTGPTVNPAHFRGPGEPYPGHWRTPPAAWPSPEALAVDVETRAHLEAALLLLPDRQRLVIILRDVEGYPAEEVCQLLEITPENQRVLLHRARAAVRAALAAYLGPRPGQRREGRP